MRRSICLISAFAVLSSFNAPIFAKEVNPVQKELDCLEFTRKLRGIDHYKNNCSDVAKFIKFKEGEPSCRMTPTVRRGREISLTKDFVLVDACDVTERKIDFNKTQLECRCIYKE